jgi:hypothetical protein
MKFTGYLARDVQISKRIVLSEGTQIYADLDKNKDGDMAQVYFPNSHPKYAGLRTIVPKKDILLDIARKVSPSQLKFILKYTINQVREINLALESQISSST